MNDRARREPLSGHPPPVCKPRSNWIRPADAVTGELAGRSKGCIGVRRENVERPQYTGRLTPVFAVALAAIAVGYGAGTWAAEPAARGKRRGKRRTMPTQPAATRAAPSGVAAEKWAMLDKYCSKCHNSSDWAGGIAFEALTPDNIPEDAETWEKAVRKLRGGLMPPAGNPQPANQRASSVRLLVEGKLDPAAARAPEPGRVALHRLNRKEYANAMRDLLDVTSTPTRCCRATTRATASTTSPTRCRCRPSFMDQYLAAARTVAVAGARQRQAAARRHHVHREAAATQFFHIDGPPLGTRGGIVVEHDFPADGEYVINIANMAQAIWVYNMEFENHLVVTLDRARFYETDDRRRRGHEGDRPAAGSGGRCHQQAPQEHPLHDDGRAARDRGDLPAAQLRGVRGPAAVSIVPGGGQDRVLRVSSFEVRGPLNATGVSDTPSPRADLHAATRRRRRRGAVRASRSRSARRSAPSGGPSTTRTSQT